MSLSNKLVHEKKIDFCFDNNDYYLDKRWLDLQYHDLQHESIKKPNEIENEMEDPPTKSNQTILDRIQGSMIGMALGDALGAHVEFRPRNYLLQHPVTELQGGGTWGLAIGQVLYPVFSNISLSFNDYFSLLMIHQWLFV